MWQPYVDLMFSSENITISLNGGIIQSDWKNRKVLQHNKITQQIKIVLSVGIGNEK
jgi:hypothetical protein